MTTADQDAADRHGNATVPLMVPQSPEVREYLERRKCQIRAVARRYAATPAFSTEMAILFAWADLNYHDPATRMCLNVIELRRQMRVPEDDGDWAYLLTGAAV